MLPSQKPVSRYMSGVPIVVQQRAPLSDAIALMEEHGVRHLPVLEGESPVGIVSQRDLAMAGSLVPDAWESIPVAEAMTPQPFSVPADTPIHVVARRMAEMHYGAVLVTDAAGHVIGLFTTTDALRVLAACSGD